MSVESALNHVKISEDNDFFEFQDLVQGLRLFLALAAYQQLAEACDYPLHLGITEAGGLRSGTVKSSIGLGMLLWSGIGDTIRVSLSADPVGEVKAGFLTDHRLKDADIVDQLVELVEQKAAEIEAEKQATVDRALELAK